MNKLPTLFLTHGSPMLAIEPGNTGPLLTELGKQLIKYRITAILVISAHWLTSKIAMITANKAPETIHDFGGFPNELYQLHYPAQGAPDVAEMVKQQLVSQGIAAELDLDRGLDHGAWIPLRYLVPDASLPVIQLSMPWPIDAKQALAFGAALRPLRDQGLLIITSGSMTHNLYDVGDSDEAPQYIAPFVSWVRQAVMTRNVSQLEYYREIAPYATQAHPTDEHFLPLMVAVGASDIDDTIKELDGGVTYRALAMDNYIFGDVTY